MNEKEFEILGIKRFHEAGIKGQGITIASRESDRTVHGKCVYELIKQVVPEANIKLKCDYNKDNDFDVYTTSLFFASDKTKEKRSQQLIDKNKILICAAGNEGSETQTPLSRLEQWLSIGAVHLLSDGKIEIPKYSSIFSGLDFMSFSNLNVPNKVNKIKGTSFSAPIFASMCALVQCYFLEHTVKKLTYNQMLQFIEVNCIDLNEKGYDNRSGYGLFVLPEPDKIDISKYGGITMFKDYAEWEQALNFLADRKRIDSPEVWRNRIKRDNDVDLMWFLTKWANDVQKLENK